MESMMNFTAPRPGRRICQACDYRKCETYILADDPKIGVTSFVKVAPIKRAMIITNQSEPQRLKVLKEKRRL